MDSLGAVVACGRVDYNLEVYSSECWAYDGSIWTSLPESTQQHFLDTPPNNLMVSEGWWVASPLTDLDDHDYFFSDTE